MSILDELAKNNVITRYQIDEILNKAKEFGGNIDQALIELKIPEDQILAVKEKYFQLPTRAVDIKAITTDLLNYIPQEAANYYHFVPVGLTDGVLEVGITDPSNIEARNALQFIASRNNITFKLFLIAQSDFTAVMGQYKGLGSEVSSALSELEDDVLDVDERTAGMQDELKEAVAEAQQAGKTLENTSDEKIVEAAPVTKMVAVILKHASEGRASDVHIENTGDNVKVRFRVDGVLHTSLLLPKNVHNAVVARVKILAKLKLDEKRKPQDGRFFAKIEGRKIDFRVSTFPTFHGEKAVIRILDPDKGVKKLETTGMRTDHIEMVREAVKRPYGMILITGPTGSGKTTTLYSMLQEIDREKRNVVSLEDPIEYNIGGMNQSQVKPEIGYTFANGLRSILRQDPDVIMVGEIRDKETAQLAIQAALTGHLVFSTLHTNNSVGVIPRLIDMGVDPYLIAPTLILAIAQRLVRSMCKRGGKAVPISDSMKRMFTDQFADLPRQYRDQVNLSGNVYEAQPTPECPAGVKGRQGVFEMFRMSRDIEETILTNPVETAIYDMARKNGMLTMKEDAILKALKGDIPFNEVNTL